MDDEDYRVSSEIYEENDYKSTSKPVFNPNYAVSKFDFSLPQLGIEKDKDGDLIVPRKKSSLKNKKSIEIEHSKSTVIDLVGLQIWRGALLLADWLIHNHDMIPKNSHILEVASGVGLTSIVGAMYNPILCTDVDKGDILGLIKSNVERNKHIVQQSIKVLELDFTSPDLPLEIEENLSNISVIIAADTVYDDVITDAFVKTMERLLFKPPSRTVYVALEKRYVFTIADCDSVAPCYEYFLECLRNSKNLQYEEVPLSFPKYFEYDRVKELVLWRVTSRNV